MVHREAAHPNFGILFDCYHFWSGPSKFEDMDWIKPGEIIHAHLNDTRDLPRELLDLQSRVIPGDGVAPLAKILRKLRERATRDRCRWNCSCRNSSRPIPSTS
jgi:sugar phosphate isomerase/epimerase